MNIKFKLDDTTISIGPTYNRELDIDLNTNVNDVKEILKAIYDEMSMDDFISTLDQDQINDIVEYSKELEDERV